MFDLSARVVSVDRTDNLDAVNEAIILGPTRLKLPGNAMSIPDFVPHMTSLTRVFDQELNRGKVDTCGPVTSPTTTFTRWGTCFWRAGWLLGGEQKEIEPGGCRSHSPLEPTVSEDRRPPNCCARTRSLYYRDRLRQLMRNGAQGRRRHG